MQAEAGQFFNFRFMSGTGWMRAHPYSLSAAPDGRSLRITVKVVGDGSAALRLLRPGAPFGELHDQMLAITPAGAELEFHVNLLRHGRRTCHAQRPACRLCALRRMCPGRQE